MGSAVNQRVFLDDGQDSVDSSCLLSGVILARVVETSSDLPFHPSLLANILFIRILLLRIVDEHGSVLH